MITALVCHISLGAGALNLQAGIVPSPRYDGAAVTIELRDGAPADIVVDGAIDHAWRYSQHGMRVSARQIQQGWLIDIAGADQREHMLIDQHGRLLWAIAGYAAVLDAAAVSIYTGSCEVSQ